MSWKNEYGNDGGWEEEPKPAVSEYYETMQASVRSKLEPLIASTEFLSKIARVTQEFDPTQELGWQWPGYYWPEVEFRCNAGHCMAALTLVSRRWGGVREDDWAWLIRSDDRGPGYRPEAGGFKRLALKCHGACQIDRPVTVVRREDTILEEYVSAVLNGWQWINIERKK